MLTSWVKPGLRLERLDERTVPAVLVSSTGIDSGDGRSFTAEADALSLETTHGVSADGRYVVFTSLASDLTSDPNLSPFPSYDIYVRDLLTGTTELVSVDENGFAAGGLSPVISGDGRSVAFIAGSSICLRDLDANTTEVIAPGSQPTISDFGDAVAFVSPSQLAPLDTNDVSDVYIYYPNGKQFVLASYNPTTNEAANARSFDPVLAIDGSRVSFLSDATNLTTSSDTNNYSDLFSYQPVSDTLALVNVSSSGGYTTDWGVSQYRADNFGRRFAFTSASFELLSEPGLGGYPFLELYLRDITESGGTTLITRLPDGQPSGGSAAIDFSISGDGEYVAFTGQPYTSDPIPNLTNQLYLYDAISDFYVLLSQNALGTGADAGASSPVVSQNGRYVMFRSASTDLVPGVTTTAGSTLFVRDFLAGKTFAVSTDAAGTTTVPIEGSDFNHNYGISRNGATAYFTNVSADGAYGATDTNGVEDVYASAVPVLEVPRPTVTVEQAFDQGDPTNAASVRFRVEFSLPVVGFGGDDLSFAGSTVGGNLSANITTIDSRVYTVEVAGMTTSGDVVLSILAGAASYRPPVGLLSLGSTSTDNRIFVDRTAPISQVAPLPLVAMGTSFPVSWTGADDAGGIGLAGFDVLVSTDGGAWTLWQENTTITSALFAGEFGKRYAFASVGIDHLGNREALPLVPDAQTQTPIFQRNLAAIPEDTTAPPGVTVSSLLGAAMSDTDPGALEGVAIVAANGSGAWQYSVNGSTWAAMSGISHDAAWLLPDSYRVRFVPAANWNGTANLLLRGWDRTWGSAGTKAAVPEPDAGTPFTAGAALVTIQVTPVNDRPMLPALPVTLRPTGPNPADPPTELVGSLVSLASDVDGDSVGVAIVGQSGSGVWQFSTDGGAKWADVGVVSAASGLLLDPQALVRFRPNVGATGKGSLTVKAWDQTSGAAGERVNTSLTTAFSTGTASASTAINNAPTLTGTNPPLTMAEDLSPNPGFAVSTLLAGRFADNGGSMQGVAITAIDAMNHGVWQFSINNGTTWNAIPNVAANAALLLRSTDKVRFAANADFHGNDAATLTYRAWDQTYGIAGKTVDVANHYTGAFFSATGLTASLNVTPVADRPTLETSGTPALPHFLPGATATSARVADLIAGRVTDPESSDFGIAITALAGNGTWEFSLNDGASWVAIGPVSASSGRVLNGDALVRFRPAATFRGVASFSFKAWDLTGGTSGALVPIAATSTAFSAAVEQATVSINNAPTLNTTPSPALPTIAEDTANPAGAAVSTLLGTAFGDADGVSVPRGIAVTAVSSTGGVWQYTTNGSTWLNVGPVSDGSALLLRSTDKLRFLPAANWSGQATVDYRAWDQTAGVFGGRADTNDNGGSSAFSTATEMATVTVTAVNDRPAPAANYLPGKMHLPSVAPGTASPAGVRIADLVGAWIIDVDGNPVGMAVSGLTGTASGRWEYSTDGASWLPVGAVSTSSALLLADTDWLRFVPNGAFNGSAEVRFRAWDQTRGTARTRLALSSSVLGDSIGLTELAAPVWVNTAPVFAAE